MLAMFCLTLPATQTQAGLFDQIKAAAQDVKNVTKGKGKAAEDPDRPLHLEDHDKTGSCEGKRSATCMDYMELADHCMEPLKGYRMKLTGDLLEKKLKTEQLTDRKRKKIEEELAMVRESEKKKSDNQNVSGLTEEDQVCINADYGAFYKKIYNKCMGADHMGTGKRTEMMQDQETLTCEQAIAQLREKRANEVKPFDCLKGISTLRFTIMADMMEKKMNAANLSAKERADWEADIASIRELPTSGAMMPKAIDPSNPTRALMRLTTDEQMALNTEYSKQSQAAIAECQKTGPTRNTPKSGGLVDRSKSPANKRAKPVNTDKNYDDLNKGRGGSTNLLALRRDKGCADALKGHLAKVTADTLENKLKAASGVSDQKRKEWQEDIAAWRAAQAQGKDSPESPDPNNPYRWYDYVSNAERAAINKQHLDFSNKIIKECNSKPSGL